MKNILEHADREDFEFLARVLSSPVHLRATEKMFDILVRYREEPSDAKKEELVEVIERRIRYSGSADLAYAARWALRREPGVSTDQIIHDVAKRLKVAVPPIGPLEAKLEQLAEGVMARELFKMSAEEQRDLIRKQGLDPKATREALFRLRKHGPVFVVREAIEDLVTGLVTKAIGRLVGREAARHLITNLAGRFPWWTRGLGPAVWGVTGLWAVLDVQGPAYRRTIPAMLYISLIAVRGSHGKKHKHKKKGKHHAEFAPDADDEHAVRGSGAPDLEAPGEPNDEGSPRAVEEQPSSARDARATEGVKPASPKKRSEGDDGEEADEDDERDAGKQSDEPSKGSR